MSFKQLTRRNYPFLLERLDSSHEFFGRLQQNEAIQHKIAYIKEHPTSRGKTDALLSALLDLPDLQDSVMDDVIQALRSSGQAHVANVFRRVSDKVPLSDEHYRLLQTKTAELCKYVDPENGLLDQLFSLDVISSSEVERIRFATGRNEMTRKLIDIFMKKSDDAFEMLVMALNEVGQTHVAYMLTGQGNVRPLSQKLRDELILNRVKLISSIYFNGLVSVLMSKRVFTDYDQQQVESRQTENEKIERTLDLIARKSQSAFYEFIAALVETHHEHVVIEMMGVEIAAKVVLICDTFASAICATNLEKELREVMQNGFESGETEVKEPNDALDECKTYFTGVEEGSIIVKFRCKNVEALQELHRSKTLDKLFTDTFCPPFAHKGLKSIRLQIQDGQFQQCAETLAALKMMTPEHREALLSSAKFLVDRTTVSDELLDRLPLCGQRRKAIETAATHEEQVKTLLDIISRQPDTAFTHLLNALRDTEQEQSALIICAPLLDLREDDTLPQQPEATWQMAKVSMRHLISKCQSIDDETIRAVKTLQTSLSRMRQMCSATVDRPQRGEAVAEPQKVDSCQKSLEVTEVTANGAVTAKHPVSVSHSTQTSLKENRLTATENTCRRRMNLFRDSCTVDIIRSDERVYGVTSLHNNLFVLRADRIDVYMTTSNYAFLHSLPLAGLKGHEWNDLTSSVLRACLYVADCANKLIRAVELGGSVGEWVVPDCPCGVSVTPDDDALLVTCAYSRQLRELGLDGGDWLRRVDLSPDIQRPLHAVKLTTGHYVVSHSCARGLTGQHRVCVVDATGSILLSYGAQSGSGNGQLDWPCHISLDKDDSVFVADSTNNRIVLLNAAAQLVREYVGSLSHPRRLHFERATRRLCIGELAGRVVVVQLNDCAPSHSPSIHLLDEQSRPAPRSA